MLAALVLVDAVPEFFGILTFINNRKDLGERELVRLVGGRQGLLPHVGVFLGALLCVFPHSDRHIGGGVEEKGAAFGKK